MSRVQLSLICTLHIISRFILISDAVYLYQPLWAGFWADKFNDFPTYSGCKILSFPPPTWALGWVLGG
ncbi:hypothetical protein Hypma_003147 [Hypsizygus marmoreus]|uniref:Uncharacterized protein n=1 Tax=Hypsizygus marmoreus TaxID=39966 RepID=A0A369K0Y5_HYPMA|nr:hypothetical protein Hypma_003147 [Hypsizygus marmoreus]